MITKENFVRQLDNPISSLSRNELETILNTYRMIPNKQVFAMKIMTRLFLEHKEIRHFWDFVDDSLNTEDEILASRRTQFHAKNVIGAFGALIEAASNGSAVIGLDQVGRYHRSFGVKPSDFWHFEESFLYALKEYIPNMSDDTEANWHRFIIILVSKLVEGMREDPGELINLNGKRKNSIAHHLDDIRKENEYESKDYLPLLIITFLFYLFNCFVSLVEFVFCFTKMKFTSRNKNLGQ